MCKSNTKNVYVEEEKPEDPLQRREAPVPEHWGNMVLLVELHQTLIPVARSQGPPSLDRDRTGT